MRSSGSSGHGSQLLPLLAFSTVYFFDLVFRHALSAVLPWYRVDTGFSYAQLGLILSAYFLGYGAMQIPGGILTDKLDVRKLVIISMIVTSIIVVLFPMGNTFWQAFLIMLLIGVASAVIFVGLTKLTALAFDYSVRARVQGSWAAAGSLGGSVVMVIGPLMAAWGMWRELFYISGIIGLLATLFAMRYIFRLKTHALGSSYVNYDGEMSFNSRELLSRKNVWLLCLAQLIFTGVAVSRTQWTTAYLKEFTLLSAEEIAIYTVALIPASIIGPIISGWVADRIGRRNGVIICFLISNAFLALWIWVSFPGNPLWVLILIAQPMMIFSGAVFTNYVLAAEIGGTKYGGLITGLVNTFGMGIGGFVFPYLIGIIIEIYASYPLAFLFLVITTILGVMLELGVKEEKMQK